MAEIRILYNKHEKYYVFEIDSIGVPSQSPFEKMSLYVLSHARHVTLPIL